MRKRKIGGEREKERERERERKGEKGRKKEIRSARPIT